MKECSKARWIFSLIVIEHTVNMTSTLWEYNSCTSEYLKLISELSTKSKRLNLKICRIFMNNISLPETHSGITCCSLS